MICPAPDNDSGSAVTAAQQSVLWLGRAFPSLLLECTRLLLVSFPRASVRAPLAAVPLAPARFALSIPVSS